MGWNARRLLAGSISLALLSAAPALATNGTKLTAYGSRAAGRGGVDYAYADDATGPATNPAGMAFVYGNRIDNNWAVIDPRVTWTNVVDGFRIEHQDRDKIEVTIPAFSFGATFDPTHSWELKNLFKLGDWGLKDEPSAEALDELAGATEEEILYGSKLRLGIGLFPLSGGSVQIKDMITTGFGTSGNRRPVDWEAKSLQVALTPSIAYRFNSYFSMGLNVQLIYASLELDGGIAQPSTLLRDDFELANAILSVRPQILTESDMDDAITWGFSWRVGMMFNPADWLTIGVVYQDRTYMADYLGRNTVDATDEIVSLTNGNFNLLQAIDATVDPARGFVSEYDLRVQDFNLPRQFGLGFVLRLHRRFSFGLDYTFILWNEVSKKFKVRLSNGTNPNMDIIVSPTIPVRVPLNFKDQHVVAVGATWLAAEGQEIIEGVPSWALALRMGYNYGENPVPGNTTQPQLPAIMEHHATFGFTLHWGPLVELNFAFEYAFRFNKLKTGPNHIGDFTLSNSEQDASLFVYQFGVGLNF